MNTSPLTGVIGASLLFTGCTLLFLFTPRILRWLYSITHFAQFDVEDPSGRWSLHGWRAGFAFGAFAGAYAFVIFVRRF